MRPTVILFDIDGTLLDTGGAGRRAVRRAFAEVHARPDACDGLSFGGRTDPWIFGEGSRHIGAPTDAVAIQALLAAYLRALADELALSESYRVHPGALHALAHAEASGCAVGLGTGNVREGAMLKLQRASLDGRFAFGGFGCDAAARHDLLRAGAVRGAAQLGVEVSACRIVVLGDTPHDVDAARAIGATAVAVTTGSFDAAALHASGADLVVDGLDAPDALLAIAGPV